MNERRASQEPKLPDEPVPRFGVSVLTGTHLVRGSKAHE